MIHRISISVEDIIQETINQNSQDFRGMRTLKPEFDAVFEDFVATTDDAEAINSQLKNISAMIYQEIKGYVSQWYVDAEVCYYVNSEIDSISLEMILRNTLVYAILSWWYQLRMPELSASYFDKYTIQLAALRNAVTPKFYNRKLRMF